MSIRSVSSLTMFAVLALGVSVVLLFVAVVPQRARQSAAWSVRDLPSSTKRTKGRVADATELVAVFIASSTCGASAHPTLPEALGKIRASLGARATAAGKRFIFIGVALDEQPSVGLAFLEPFGPFDEVMAGGSWVGTGAVDFLIRGNPGPLALPQLLILERDIKAEASAISISEDRVLARKLGFDEITQAAEDPLQGLISELPPHSDPTAKQGRS